MTLFFKKKNLVTNQQVYRLDKYKYETNMGYTYFF